MRTGQAEDERRADGVPGVGDRGEEPERMLPAAQHLGSAAQDAAGGDERGTAPGDAANSSGTRTSSVGIATPGPTSNVTRPTIAKRTTSATTSGDVHVAPRQREQQDDRDPTQQDARRELAQRLAARRPVGLVLGGAVEELL